MYNKPNIYDVCNIPTQEQIMNLMSMFQHSESFLAILREYFAYIAPGKTEKTLEKHQYFFEAIERYFTSVGKLEIQLHEIKVRVMEDMRTWLHAEKKRTQEHVSRHLLHCREAMNYAVMIEKIGYNPIVNVKKLKEKASEPVSLTSEEVFKLQHADFNSFSRMLVIDLFLFQCFTGLSYIDLWNYHIEDDVIEVEGERVEIKFITSVRGKNGKPYSVEFNKHAQTIHEKYNGKFPAITNAAYNRIIKKVFFSLNFRKQLCLEGSTHNGRKTYSTLRYAQGLSLEAISDEMGNTPAIQKKYYITFSRERVKREISNLKTPFLPTDKK